MVRAAHLDRVVRSLGASAEFVERLAALPAGDLRALLLDLAARRAGNVRPPDLLRQYEAGPSFLPAPIEPTAYRHFETSAFELLPDGFEAVELAPHAPLGTSAVLGAFSQDRALTTIGDSEVVSDSTNVLALECAHRRRDPALRRRRTPVRLAASHRLLRPRDAAHFGLVALCTAGRDRGSWEMQASAMREHIDWHLRVLTRHAPDLDVEVLLTDLSGGARRATLDDHVARPLAAAFPAAACGFDDERRAGRAYYRDACFSINAVHAEGSRSNLSDGGFTDWTARLLADRKERLMISGLGAERLLELAPKPSSRRAERNDVADGHRGNRGV